jgi:hypothetical protein
MSDFDRCFEANFCGNKQMMIVHKYHVGGDVWHVCTVDCHDYYHSAYYQLDRSEGMSFKLIREA